ncbi:PIR Superfamily Protein [Plasmodium ovale wallikeri]|uniref:PIR Superfamily Protein n=1 Tax=Plasmodium ovale wallikeri TaxID=864142 RepID=A0A1A8YPC7_PLAOA|nr:PIR Superfamily Protein [Plasmodium ovale wallikeri]SBT59110.1 PIR Superfamily Protein [Plasmodium ovale wallikeri]
MSEDIVAKALNLLEKDGALKKISDLHKFYEKASPAIDRAYAEYEKCIRENKNKKVDGKLVDSYILCNIHDSKYLPLDSHIEDFKSAFKQESKRCDYMLYWMSDKIAECKYNTHRIIWLYNMFKKFWDDTDCSKKKEDCLVDDCKEKLLVEFDAKVLKNKKELYLFVEHYNNIENTLKNEKDEKKGTYCKYAKYIFDLYSFMVNEDKELAHNKYEKELKHFQYSFSDENKLNTLKTACKYQNFSVKSQSDVNNSSSSIEKFERFIPDVDYLSTHGDKIPEKMDDVLGDTPSYKLYKIFDEDADNSSGKECSEKYFTGQITYKDKCISICKKIRKNFDKLYDTKNPIKGDNPCLHYKNWVYREIWDVITTNDYYKYTGEIISKFLKLQEEKNVINGNNKDICYYYFIFKDFIELNAKKEEKDLHDYFKNYYNIEEKISTVTNDTKKYKDYLEYIYKLYIRHKIGWNCCHESGVDPLCTHYFKCEEEYNPKDLLDMLNGTSKDDIKMKYKHIPAVHIGERKKDDPADGDNVMRIQYGRCSRIYDPEDKTKVISLRCDYQASRDHYDNFYKKLPDGKKNDAENLPSAGISPVNMDDSSGMPSMAEEPNPTNYKIPTSVALGLGTAFTFLLYYKFTPFGSLFGRRGQGKTNFEEDFNEEYMQEFQYDSEYEDVNMHNRRMHIAYQRV